MQLLYQGWTCRSPAQSCEKLEMLQSDGYVVHCRTQRIIRIRQIMMEYLERKPSEFKSIYLLLAIKRDTDRSIIINNSMCHEHSRDATLRAELGLDPPTHL